MNFAKMFSRGGASSSGSKKVTKRSRAESDALKGALNKDYKRVNSRSMLLTKWVCEEFLSRNERQEGLHHHGPTLGH
jgi:hypothetical protein